jgi:hypothetical protein
MGSEMLSREEIMEKQWSRMEWLKDGDRNTAFFQAKSRVRAKRNIISSLKREDGSVALDQAEIEEVASTFYKNLFTAQDDLDPNLILQHVPRKINETMNDRLLRPYSAGEVERALFAMGANKAPRPDGFTAGFYQLHWDLLGANVTDGVLEFLNGGILPENLNRTTLVLIPKTRNPQEMKEFRLISLCNVLYKICSKVLALQLREFLDEIIAEEQSAFVPGRLITDNILVAYECIHYLKRKKGKLGACAVKLDMAKDYDRVEWEYLRGIMLKLGFHASFVDLAMKCVTSVSFSVRVNGTLTESFKPTQGIRQGDPISPYLFLLCSEGLSCLLTSIGPMHLSRGVRVGIHSPWVSHLLFADDCIVFSEATHGGANRLLEILEKYSKGSGQLVNREKSAIFFSKNCSQQMRDMVCNGLQIYKEALAEKYLGLPTEVGRDVSGTFEYLPTQVKGKIQGWCGHEASCAGREVLVLLKSIAQAVPTYLMSCFLLPLNICKKIKSATANYWWGSSADNKHLHWMSWDRLTMPKCKGGMGFRDLRSFNLAMLGKQGWRLIMRPDSLCARVLKGRYFHDSDFMLATRKKRASSTWRAILAGREPLQMGLIKTKANGDTTRIWRDRWIAKHFDARPITPRVDQQLEMVSQLLTGSGQWNETLVREQFLPIDAEAIPRQPLGHGQLDSWAWEKERFGVYTVKSAYKLLYNRKMEGMDGHQPSSSDDRLWKSVWKLSVPPKVKVFWWRVLHEFLPAKQILHRRHIEPLAYCEICGDPEESIRHVPLECSVAKEFWL